jgi:hypothetical protein
MVAYLDHRKTARREAVAGELSISEGMWTDDLLGSLAHNLRRELAQGKIFSFESLVTH